MVVSDTLILACCDYNYRARWYDANLYCYAGNSPLVNVDPSGLCNNGCHD